MALIDKLIFSSKNLSVDGQLDISKSLLLSIYDIASEPIKKNLKDYILTIKSIDVKEKHDYLIFELLLIIREFRKINQKIIEELSDYFKQFADSRKFSSIFYVLNDQIDYLIEEKDYLELKPISKKIKVLIENYEKSERLSIF